jgi:hypothetical protein
MKKTLFAAVASIALSSGAFAQSTNVNFSGNGNTGFGGVIGTGTLNVSNNEAGNLAFTLTKGGGNFNDAIVFYIDSVAGGFGSTLDFNDQADNLRQAISGASGGTTGIEANTRSIVTFNTGFTANYAIALNNGFAGLWQLASGGNNSLSFVTGANLLPTPATNNSPSYTWNINVTDIGLTTNSGQSFKFVGTYLNGGNSFRSDEALGFSIAGGNPGNGGIGSYPNTVATSEFTFETVPEPSTYALLALAATALGAHVVRRRRRS